MHQSMGRLTPPGCLVALSDSRDVCSLGRGDGLHPRDADPIIRGSGFGGAGK